jgi:DNA-binding NtrC family response regulator
MSTILCITDEPAVGVVLEDALARIGHQVVIVSGLAEAIRAIRLQPIELILADDPTADPTTPDILDLVRQEEIDLPVIIMTGYASVENAVLAMRKGASDYITKPLRFEALRIAVTNALEVNRLRRENESIRREITSLRGMRKIVGESRTLREVMETIASVAPTRATILLEGESGTGKELFARAIHEQSPRTSQSFITVNCAALPEGLVESTLFGHERGAFTGATVRFAGAFERAHGGTLLLDEISEMNPNLQAKLLRAIQEQEFERVGGSQPVKVNVRIIATTNRDLAAEVDAGRFRRDLFYRLSVVPIRTPPLRDRLTDIPLLVAHFVAQVAEELGIRPPQVAETTIEHLKAQPWPGNIRELANAVERAVILCRSGRLTPESFGFGRTPGRAPQPVKEKAASQIRKSSPESDDVLNLRILEQKTIERALRFTGGHRARAAGLLGISERTLRNKLNTPKPDAYESESDIGPGSVADSGSADSGVADKFASSRPPGSSLGESASPEMDSEGSKPETLAFNSSKSKGLSK